MPTGTVVYPAGTPSDWAGVHGKPYITVSAKGISNGLSSIPNDGADFGPDTMLNATAPNQYGPPYTQTYGIQEALNYANTSSSRTIVFTGTFNIPGDPNNNYIFLQAANLNNLILDFKNAFINMNNTASGYEEWIFRFVDSQNITIKNAKIKGDITSVPSGAPGANFRFVRLEGCSNIKIINNELENAWGNLVSMEPDSNGNGNSDILIEGNVVGATDGGITPGLVGGSYVNRVQILNNNANTWDTAGPNFDYASDVIIENNIFRANAVAIDLILQANDAYVNRVIIANNYLEVYGNGSNVITLHSTSSTLTNLTMSIKIHNNIIRAANPNVSTTGISTYENAGNWDIEITDNIIESVATLSSTIQPTAISFYLNDNVQTRLIAGNVIKNYWYGVGVGTSASNITLQNLIIKDNIFQTIVAVQAKNSVALIEGNIMGSVTLNGVTLSYQTPAIENFLAAGSIIRHNTLISPYWFSNVSTSGIIITDNIGQTNTPSTPSVPASGTAQQNTNNYPVDVALYGGTVTQITITRNGTNYTVFSNSSGAALSGQVYRLNPNDSITLTYSSAPTWTWLPA